MGTALDEARADLETARQQVVRATALVERLEGDVPRTGEDVARMMREAWPGEWDPSEFAADCNADLRRNVVSIRVHYAPKAPAFVGWFSVGKRIVDPIVRLQDFPAFVSALRAAHASLLADLRALAPEGEEDSAGLRWTPDFPVNAIKALREMADALGIGRDKPLTIDVPAAVAALVGERDALRLQVERLTRERAEALEAAECSAKEAKFERARANEELARAHDAERARDKAAGVAREALDWLSAAALPETDRPPGSLRGIGAALARLSASLPALASPAPAPDPLAGLPEGVAHAVRDVADGTFGGVEVLGWYVEIVGPPTADFVLVWTDGDRLDRLLRVSPDGEITREVAP